MKAKRAGEGGLKQAGNVEKQQLGPHTADEERVACENSPPGPVLHEEANAILRVARRMHARHLDVA